MFLANATEMHDIMDTILKQCIESDKHSFEYLSSFYGVLGAALQYSEKYSEKINDESKRAALLKKALCEIIEEQGKNPHAQESLNPSNKRIRLWKGSLAFSSLGVSHALCRPKKICIHLKYYSLHIRILCLFYVH